MKFVDVYTCGGLSVWNIQCRGLMGVDVNDNVIKGCDICGCLLRG